MLQNRPVLHRRSRSSVTNGKRLFLDGNGGSAWGRRFRDLMAQHCADLGGAEILSTAEISLLRRAVTLEVELEKMEAQFSRVSKRRHDVLTNYAAAASHLRRILETLGIKRIAREVDPIVSIERYVATKREREQQEQAEAEPK
jgi:hypothetical protein